MTDARSIIQGVIDKADDPNVGGVPGHFNSMWVAAQLKEALEKMGSFDKLIALVKELHDKGSYHKKRGFSLRDSTAQLASNHMIEEAVELQAEATITHDRDATIEESADVLATWLHLLLHCEIVFQEVVDRCDSKLREIFTDDPSEIGTTTPGIMRRHRQESHTDSELSAAFHEIWTAHAKCDNYDKKEWRELTLMLRRKYGVEL